MRIKRICYDREEYPGFDHCDAFERYIVNNIVNNPVFGEVVVCADTYKLAEILASFLASRLEKIDGFKVQKRGSYAMRVTTDTIKFSLYCVNLCDERSMRGLAPKHLYIYNTDDSYDATLIQQLAPLLMLLDIDVHVSWPNKNLGTVQRDLDKMSRTPTSAGEMPIEWNDIQLRDVDIRLEPVTAH